MTTYIITNTAGTSVATISPTTSTGASFPVELIGMGVSLYGPVIAQNQYRQLENFAKTTPPINPVRGQFWYDTNANIPNFYDGIRFIALLAATSSVNSGVAMLPTSKNVDFTTTGQRALYQAPGTGLKFYPTAVLLIPTAVNAVTAPPSFNLFTSTSEDIMENVALINPTLDKHSFFSIEGMTRTVSGTQTIYLDVTGAATGGTGLVLTYDTYLFGYTTV